nr:response regulator [Pseudomonas sp. P818]
MKVLLIEDEEHKRAAIAQQVHSCVGQELVLVECESLRGGLRAIISDENFDLILLDMSMPGFDSSEGSSDFEEPESFAGKEILAQMKFRGIRVPVVVVTQYKAFARGTVGLEELTDFCSKEFSGIFQEAIYYSTVVESWKKDLMDAIQRAKK